MGQTQSIVVRRVILLGCMFMLIQFGRAIQAEPVMLVPPLRVGATANLEVKSTRERNVPGQAPVKRTIVTPVRLEVLETTDEQTVIGFTSGKAKLDDAQLAARMGESMDELVELGADQTLEIVLDEEFTPVSIRNLDDVMQVMQKVVDLMEKTLPKDKAAAAVLPRVRELFSNRDSVETITLQKPGQYFLAYGWELEPGESREVETTLPSPFGAPLPAIITIELRPFDQTDEHYIVDYKTELDQEGVQRLIAELMQKVAGDAPGADRPIPKFDVKDTAEYKINRETGWVERAVVKRTTTAQGGTQIDVFEYQLAK